MNTASGREEIASGATSASCSYRNDPSAIGGPLSQGAALARLRESGEHEIWVMAFGDFLGGAVKKDSGSDTGGASDVRASSTARADSAANVTLEETSSDRFDGSVGSGMDLAASRIGDPAAGFGMTFSWPRAFASSLRCSPDDLDGVGGLPEPPVREVVDDRLIMLPNRDRRDFVKGDH